MNRDYNDSRKEWEIIESSKLERDKALILEFISYSQTLYQCYRISEVEKEIEEFLILKGKGRRIIEDGRH